MDLHYESPILTGIVWPLIKGSRLNLKITGIIMVLVYLYAF